jgi:hypothetical protein
MSDKRVAITLRAEFVSWSVPEGGPFPVNEAEIRKQVTELASTLSLRACSCQLTIEEHAEHEPYNTWPSPAMNEEKHDAR